MNIFAPILSALAILSHHSDNNVRGFEVVISEYTNIVIFQKFVKH